MLVAPCRIRGVGLIPTSTHDPVLGITYGFHGTLPKSL
jgi:hypothetical protein